MGDLHEIKCFPGISSPYYKVTSQGFHFDMKGVTAVITLCYPPNSGCDERIEIEIGNQYVRTEQTIRNIPGMLSEDEYRGFWVTWLNSIVRVGVARDQNAFMTQSSTSTCITADYVRIQMLGNDSRNLPLSCRFAISPLKRSPKVVKRVKGGKAEWVPYAGHLPDNALIGGYCTERRENLYIIRGKHRGSVTPGKFAPSENIACVSWGGAAHEKDTFEVLCGFNVQWVPTCSNVIPAGAVPGGTSEDRGETLYIGRAPHKGHVIPGKVQPTHKACYIPYKGREIGIDRYEILIDPEQVPSSAACEKCDVVTVT